MADPPLIRLLVLIGSLARGGAEQQVRLLLRGLPRDRVTAHLACFRIAPEDLALLQRCGVGVTVLPAGPAGVWWVPVLARLARLVRRERADVVHSFLPSFDILAPALRLFRPGLRVVTSRRVVDDILDPKDVRLLRTTGRFAHAIVGNSEDVIESVRRLERHPAERLRSIPNGIPLPDPVTAEERRAARAVFGIGDSYAVVYLANFRPGKGHRYLPEIVRDVAAREPRALFLLAGEMERNSRYRATAAAFRAEVERLAIEPHVRCLGVVQDTRALIAAADVVLSLSDVEGMSNAVMEAMAHGRAVVATDAGGVRELVRDGEDGWIVERGRRGEAAAKLLRLAADPALGAAMGDSARRRMGERFSVERMVEAYVKLYEAVAASGRPPR